MKTKIVTALWLNVEGFPFQGTRDTQKTRYFGSLLSHCKNIDLPIVCYTHEINWDELVHLKEVNNLSNLELKLLELKDMKLHGAIEKVRETNYIEELAGRGPEIMWGKFQCLEQELDGFDMVYWVDAGIQHPVILPWMFNSLYADASFHQGGRAAWADNEISQYNFPKLFNGYMFEKLNILCNGKFFNIVCNDGQGSYRFKEHGISDNDTIGPYPLGGVFGGDVSIVRKYLELFWAVCDKVLKANYYCTDQSVMKMVLDLFGRDSPAFYLAHFDCHYYEHRDFHFKLWDNTQGYCKPFYMVFIDILNS